MYHIHGSAAGAFPGVAASASPDGKLKAKGRVEAEVAATDEILDAFDGRLNSEVALARTLCFIEAWAAYLSPFHLIAPLPSPLSWHLCAGQKQSSSLLPVPKH